MSELSTTPISIEVTKAELTLALSKEGLAYQNLLQEGENIKFTKEGLVEQGASLKTLREVQKKLNEQDNPYTANWKAWNEAKKSLVDPITELLNRKVGEYKALALEIENEQKKAAAEKQRVDSIRSAIDNFFLSQSQAVAGAKTLGELTSIEKIIGSHKANKSRYAEFLPELISKAEQLTPLIKQQKETIKKLEAINIVQENAEKSGDDQTVLDSIEAKEELTAKFEDVSIRAQETALNMAIENDVVVPEVILPTAPKPRRSTWEWEVINIKETSKKMPDWVELSPIDEKINNYLTAKKAEGIKGEDFTFAGVRFFLKKTY